MLLLPLAAFLLLRWALQPERLGALLLQRAGAATGLELDVSRPATLGVWPRLQLELIGLAAHQPGDASDLLRAERVAVGLPLTVLWSDADVEFGELRLRRPVIDVAALQRWLARDTPDTTAPLRLPPYALRIDISDGQVLAEGWSIELGRLQATPLSDGQPFELDAAISLLREGSDPLPLQIGLQARPSHTPDGIAVDDLHAAIGANDDATAVQAGGALRVEPPHQLAADLTLQLGEAWPVQWPTLPVEIAHRLSGRAFKVDYSGPSDASGRLQLASPAGSVDPLRVGVVPTDLIAWLQQPEPRSPLPPADIEFASDRVDVDGLSIEGLRVEVRESSAGDD